MCDCIKELEKKLLTGVEFKNRKIIKVEYPQAFVLEPGFSLKPYIEVRCVLEGLKNMQVVKIFQTFCPHCGQKIGNEKETAIG